jgi:hypothetical protein
MKSIIKKLIITFFTITVILIYISDFSFKTKKFSFTKIKKILPKDLIVFLQTFSLNFIDYNYPIVTEKIFELEDRNVKFKKFSSSFFKPRGYLEQDNQNIYFINNNGILFYFSKNEIIENKKVKFKKIKTNLDSLIGKNYIQDVVTVVKDILIIDNKVFVSYVNNLNGCYSNGFLNGVLNVDEIIFSPFLIIEECKKRLGNSVGGNLKKFKDNKIVVSIGDYESYEFVGDDDPQNINSLYGKIITVDLDTKKIDILSSGHRNPQGLFYDSKNDILFSTEHGPQGGDEINVNVSPNFNKIKNYGWAISSYGEHYGYDVGWSDKIKKETNLIDDLYKVAPLNKSHKNFGFEEPIKYFTPSIGITEILKVKNNNSNNHKLLVSSMGWIPKEDIMTLHIIDFDNNFFQKNHEKIYVDDRIRDIIDLKNGQIIMSLDTSGSIALLSNVY